MKRKITSILAFVLTFVMLCGTLTSCFIFGTKEHTLTLYDNDGTTVLHTIKVEEGKAPQRPVDPTKEGYVFAGWFLTPTSSKAFDFAAVMTEDAKAYAQWKMADYNDDRDWVLSGSVNGWGSSLDGYHLTKKAGSATFTSLHSIFTLMMNSSLRFSLRTALFLTAPRARAQHPLTLWQEPSIWRAQVVLVLTRTST